MQSYAETVGGAVPNTTSYETKYDEGTKEAAKIMVFFPISAMILSAAFTYFNVFERLNKKFLVSIFHIILLVNYLLIYWKPTKILFVVFSGLLGYSSIILNSIPFLLIDIYRRREDYPNNRGLANDNSVCTLSGTINTVLGIPF